MVCVLLIEDEDRVQRLVSWILAEFEYEVVVAETPKEAAEKLGDEIKPSIIVVNTDKTEKDKGRLIEALRSLCPGVKIIDFAIQANSPKRDTGADAYLSKPFSADELIELIDRLKGESD